MDKFDLYQARFLFRLAVESQKEYKVFKMIDEECQQVRGFNTFAGQTIYGGNNMSTYI